MLLCQSAILADTHFGVTLKFLLIAILINVVAPFLIEPARIGRGWGGVEVEVEGEGDNLRARDNLDINGMNVFPDHSSDRHRQRREDQLQGVHCRHDRQQLLVRPENRF